MNLNGGVMGGFAGEMEGINNIILLKSQMIKHGKNKKTMLIERVVFRLIFEQAKP